MSFGTGLEKGIQQGMQIGSEIRKGRNTISQTGKSGRSQKSSADTASEYSGVDDGMSPGGAMPGYSVTED